MFLTSFNVYFLFGCACFIYVYIWFKTTTCFFLGQGWGMAFFGEDKLATLVWNLFYLRTLWVLCAILQGSRKINYVYPKIPLPTYEKPKTTHCRQSALIRTSAKRNGVTRAWPHWTDRTNISDHIRGNIINISSEMGHLHVQKHILLD